MHPHIKEYLQSLSALYSQGVTTEHSFRGALETLLKNMTGFTVVNEAQHIACGAPDLTLLKNNIPVGYVEAKDIGKNLDSKEYKNQFDRYKKALDNLIITDYLTFQLFEGENFITEISIGKILPGKIEPIPGNFPAFIELIRTFSGYNGKPIANSRQLAEFMAAKTQLLAEVIEKTLNDESTLHAQLQDFQEVLLPTMDNAQFADMYAQTIAYGIFVARLSSPLWGEDFTRQQAANLIPKSNPFLRKLFQYIAGYDIDENIRWIVDSLADMFNYVDIDAIRSEFISKDKDPFLHFYEDFLTRYDKKLRDAKGAYYTPLAVVKFIVNAVDDILKTDFNLAKGLADNTYLTPDPSPKERGEVREVPAYHTVADVRLWKNLLEKAKENRKKPTEAEYIMWQNLRNSKLGYKFRRQHPIGEFIPDFVCIEKKLVVEIDGSYHNEKEQIEYDKMRSEYLNEYGYSVLRFTNEDVLHNIHAVLQSISKKFATQSPPLSFGEGLGVRSGVRFHKVQILDPATGTGTFLAEVVRNIYQKFASNEGAWDDYVHQHLIPRLNGFEIMMSPYTMAHLKIETLLQEFGHNADNNQRLRIYLTNSLEEPKQNVQKLGLYKWLSDEAAEAQKIKNEMPVMVILGNPPYSGESQNKGEWILHLMEDYKKEPAGGRLQEKNPKWLNDDYAKFIRFGQYFVEKNGEGVLAYINNHSFLDNPTFRGMRYNLLQTFDKIYIIDLHGNAKKKETAPDGSKDENVFDIQQGVSINIFVKTGKKNNNTLADVFHHDIFGKRNDKYGYLVDNKIDNVSWGKLNPESPFYFFVPKNNDNKEEYETGFLITDLFLSSSVGIGTYDDDNLVSFLTFEGNNNHLYTYRPFDTRFINYDLKKVKRARYSVMRNMLYENLGLIVGRQGQTVGNMQWNLIFVSNKLVDLNVYYRGGGTVFPLYLYHEHFGQTEKVANLNAAIVAEITRIPLSITPEQIFDYIYAVLHSPLYREKYKEFLKIDFPRIPYPKNAEQFNKLSAFGEKLRHLHLMENITVPNNFANFPKQGDNKIENSFTEKSNDYQDNKVWINDSQYFDKVPEIAWKFYIGGYQPAQKWLKDRKGRTLTYEDIEHYQKIIFVLNETDRLMKEIDLTL